jgi:tyrosyl-tRNA synthetase
VVVNEVKVTDFEFEITQANAYFEKYVIIKRGKKKFALVEII